MEARPNTLSFYKNCLQQCVGSTDCINDLIAMLHVIPLTHIKHFISQEIDGLDLNCCKKLYYAQTSIHDLFSSDIIQYILSFGGLHHTKAVSKKWKQYSEQNERNHLTKLYSSINETKSPVQYDENINKTYIIDQNRTKLHKIETELGYKGPMRDIKQTVSICNSGDRVLVHDGVYNDNAFIQLNSGPENDLSIQVIGVGAAVTIETEWFIGEENSTATKSKCYIRNIKLVCLDLESDGGIGFGFTVEDNAMLWMENCTVTLEVSAFFRVWALYGSYLNVNNCRFIGENGMELSPFAKEVNITDCVFEGCGIKISNRFGERAGDEMLQLKCVGNIFDIGKNPSADFHPITERQGGVEYANSNRYMLRDNLLKGISQNVKANPNKIQVVNSIL